MNMVGHYIILTIRNYANDETNMHKLMVTILCCSKCIVSNFK